MTEDKKATTEQIQWMRDFIIRRKRRENNEHSQTSCYELDQYYERELKKYDQD